MFSARTEALDVSDAMGSQPLVEIDHWGERLTGCPTCNRWQTSDGEWCRLAPNDIMALKALKATKSGCGSGLSLITGQLALGQRRDKSRCRHSPRPRRICLPRHLGPSPCLAV